MVWFTWVSLPVLTVASGILLGWASGLFVLLMGIFSQVYYVKVFPRMSVLLGYGPVTDESITPTKQNRVLGTVTLYTASVCPFCPIVRQRLKELQKDLQFKLDEIDITFKPNIIMEKGIKSVPVIEANGQFWFGNATTAQLVAFLTQVAMVSN